MDQTGWRAALLAVAMLGLVQGAAAQAKPAAPKKKMPYEVQQHIAGLAKTCVDLGGKPNKSPGLLSLVDLNGDGIADYVIDVTQFNCEGAGASAFTNGRSGSDLSVYAGTPDGHARKAFAGSVYSVQLDKVAQPPKLVVGVAGLACGQKNAASLPFSAVKSCERALVWDGMKKVLVLGPTLPPKASK